MKKFDSLKSLIKTASVFENISGAKAYMLKWYAAKNRIQPNTMTDDDKREALNTEKYKEIIQLIGNAHGYAMSFVKFHFEHGATIEQLKELIQMLVADGSIQRVLPRPIDQYAATPKGERINGVNPFEALMDDIRNIEVRRGAKWIIDELPGDLRRSFRTLPEEEQQKLLNVATLLNDQGEEVKKRLLAKARAFSTIAEFITFAENYVKGYSNNDIASKMAKIEELEPEAGILYADDKYLMLSARTEKAQKDLCSVANWCINRGSFNNASYGGGAIQINTFDFTKSATDAYHLIGTTISYDGQVTYSHDINDRSVKTTSDPVEHFRKFGYPEQMIRVLMATLPVEAVIKRVVTDLQLDRRSPVDIFEDIIKSSYTVNTENNEAATKVIMSILMERLVPIMSKQDMMSKYLKLGAISEFSSKLFNVLFKDATPEERERVLAKNEEIYRLLHTIEARGATKLSQAMKNIIDAKAKVKQILDQGITEAVAMAEPAVKPRPTIAPPTTKPSTPSRPSPIPTKKPAVEPVPKAEAEDVINRLEAELQKAGMDLKTLISK
jgi:hypothetical protein